MEEYKTALKCAVESLEDEVSGYERYKWLLTTDYIQAEPELHQIITQAMEAERTHANEFMRWIQSRL